jgi:putative DNA primase/helicase
VNGKSTLTRAIQKAFGQHATSAEFSTFATDRDNNRGPRDDIADLYAARMVLARESRQGARLAESLVKWLTGGDLVRARKLYQHAFTFDFTGKIWLTTNYLPRIVGVDDAIWRRIYLIPFEVSFLGREDKTLLGELLGPANQQAILAWIIEGARLWYERGLEPPEVVVQTRRDYRHDQDQVARFIEECCVQGDAFRGKARALYSRYKGWAEAAGEFVITESLFGRRVSQTFPKERTNQGMVYLRLGLRDDGGRSDDR